MRSLHVLMLIVLSLCLSQTLHAAKEIEGYYVLSPGEDKIEATFLIPFRALNDQPNYERMQREIKCINGTEKYSLWPQQTFEVSFVYQGVTILMRSVYNNLSGGGDFTFLNMVVDGPISLYNYYETYHQPGPYNRTSSLIFNNPKQSIKRVVLQRDYRGELFKVRQIFYKKDLTEFLHYCPAFFERINVSTFSDLPTIIKEYNDKNCP